jgi:pre-mRNA-processing factor 17
MHQPIETVGLNEEDRKNFEISAMSKSVMITSEENDFSPPSLKNQSHQAKSWLESKERSLTPTRCFLPKKLIHSWNGHQNGVQKILWFPNSAHLLLSGGLDGKVKIWDVFKERNCLSTYSGHARGIRDIAFSNDGKTFVSSSFDKNIKVWDTESGRVKNTIARNKLGYALKIHPDDDKQHIVLVGCSDRKIYQYDLRTSDFIQEYDRHLDAVNTITFINENRWILSTSDDKTIRVWEYGIPEQIKYIAEPSMHSIPYVSTDPSGKRLLMQSMDNTILVYEVVQKIRLNKNKLFSGHNNAGYGCQVGMSPDGRFVVSGDGQGKCYFWDWKTTRVATNIKAHEGPCMGVLWHPQKTSKVVSCGWGDNLIKFWD